MPEPSSAPDRVIRAHPHRVEVAKALLVTLTVAGSRATWERRFLRLMRRVEQSLEFMEATFTAAQALRDLGTIDQAEAAFLFRELYSAWEDTYDENDPVRARLLDLEETPPMENASESATPRRNASSDRLLDRLTRRGRELQSGFHRARGESALAHMILENPDQYRDFCMTGEWSLGMEDDLPPDDDIAAEPDAKRVGLITERIIALAATETGRETLRAWQAFVDSELGGDAASGAAAVQRVRELGLISADEAVGLMDTVLGSVMSSAIEADRECARLRRAIAAFRARHGLDQDGRLPDGTEHPQWPYLDGQLERRANGVIACVLRRYGEHRAANLLLEKPDEYRRLVEEISVGAWGAA